VLECAGAFELEEMLLMIAMTPHIGLKLALNDCNDPTGSAQNLDTSLQMKSKVDSCMHNEGTKK
jgi:hypothetical protein